MSVCAIYASTIEYVLNISVMIDGSRESRLKSSIYFWWIIHLFEVLHIQVHPNTMFHKIVEMYLEVKQIF